jgi:hypothetical protein
MAVAALACELRLCRTHVVTATSSFALQKMTAVNQFKSAVSPWCASSTYSTHFSGSSGKTSEIIMLHPDLIGIAFYMLPIYKWLKTFECMGTFGWKIRARTTMTSGGLRHGPATVTGVSRTCSSCARPSQKWPSLASKWCIRSYLFK